jgi:nucleoid DNA-binding protein
MNGKLQTLEETKKKIELYQKILSKGSTEQQQIDAYIVSGDSVFKAITNLEKEGKKTGLFEDGGILSVSKRENEALKNLQAGEVVVTIAIQGSSQNLDAYIQALANTPYVSHIEKIDIDSSGDILKHRAVITLIITELI